jgi:excisionase family DNA binding protein
MSEGLMNINGASIYLKLSIRKLRELIKDNEIPFVRIGGCIRFIKEDLDRWVKKHTVKAG